MKTTKLMRWVLSAAFIAFLCLVGCDKVDNYSIGAPDDLQDVIDSVAYAAERAEEIADSLKAAKAAELEARLVEDLYQVGFTDNSSGWWGDWSKYYRLEDNSDTVYVKFKNFTGGANVWCNWVQVITTDDVRSGGNYLEYCVWRADSYSNFAWGTENGEGWNTSTSGDTHATQETSSYSSLADDSDDFTEYANLMNGADCAAMITRGGDTVYVDVKMTALSEDVLTKSFYIVENGIEDKPIRTFWTIEGCHLVFYKTLNSPMSVYTPSYDLDENWDSGSVDEIGGDDDTSGATYRADVTATTLGSDGNTYTETYYMEGITYSGFGSFLSLEAAHLVIDPNETYYCALADTATSAAWSYPYSVTTTVGAEDNTSAYLGAYSEYQTVVGEAYFHYKFVNYTAGSGNWQNWVVLLTNGQNRSSSKYDQSFMLRADAWENLSGSGTNITSNYDWSTFTTYMNGATVEITVKVTKESSTSTSSVGRGKVLKPGETIQ